MRRFFLPALGLVLVTGCSVGADENPEPVVQSSMPPVETEPSDGTPEDEAVEAYLDFWDAIVLASAEMDPEHPALEEHAVDQALELAQDGVQGVADAGLGMEGEPVLRPKVISAEPADDPRSIVIKDCKGAGDWKVVGEAEPRTDNVRVDARVNQDVFDWWVVEIQIWGPGTC
ncbi:hypothetical protein Q8791_10040 [Nocardiopsis sp. CT-R113]|uniref:Secreted protein n=1 Tax=Nocardiopsis codii TaxID=3065942 RepID=A0ABU7K5N3_9ACTN|nr:hypothetical protein [Nocardiopsis sp. CT-R113]MEE2037560.1 hypothetical protein [Nocardiopsis sp. CT-R113]